MGWKDTTECILSKILTEGENLDLDRMELSWVKWLEPNWYNEAMTGLYRQKKNQNSTGNKKLLTQWQTLEELFISIY